MQTLKKKYNRIIKVVVSAGLGSRKDDKEKMESVQKSLSLITGQKPKVNQAKKSIATFKLRQGMPIGYSITLRGARMYDFLEKFINIAIPRTRDFRGLSPDLIDEAGNITIGLREHIVFPEVSKEDIKSAFGLAVTIVTDAKTKEEAFELLKLSGVPFLKKIK